MVTDVTYLGPAAMFLSRVSRIYYTLSRSLSPVHGMAWTLLVLAATLLLPGKACAGHTGYIFVSHEQSNDIAVIDPQQDYRIIKWIRTSHRPRELRFRKDHQQILVACEEDDVIDVVDVATLQVADHIPTGPHPVMFALSQDEDFIYVPDKARSTIDKISVTDKLIEREIPTGADPEAIIAGSDGKTLYVTSAVNHMVHVVDLEAAAVTDNIQVGTHPARLLAPPGSHGLWVSNQLSGELSIVDRSTKLVSGTLDLHLPHAPPGRPTPVGMTTTHDGATVVVALGQANAVAFIDARTLEIEDYSRAGLFPWAVAFSADDRLLYVLNRSSDDLTIVDMLDHGAVRSVAVGPKPYALLVDE
ncbi:YVTN family beta-propeller repeat protein [Rhodopila globiformis]|nr:beta-propeller fold lactonase family protein [Rhodopila globiformis]